MTTLVIGSTGTLGQALLNEGRNRSISVVGAARHGASLSVDVSDAGSVSALVGTVRPGVIVNCAALTDLAACERDPTEAWAVNARAVALVADVAREARLVHISTDHFFSGDGADLHDEAAPVRLVNEYARSKLAGEFMAMTHPDALVLRTNVVGWRNWRDRPNFLEWAVGSLERGARIDAFTDYYTSSIDAAALAVAVFDLVLAGTRGVLNVASSEVSNKFDFVQALARQLGLDGANISRGSVRSLPVVRAESAGLDVRRAERILGRKLPGLAEVLRSLLSQRAAACAF